MAVGSADICQAINVAWDASGLNELFESSWDDGTKDFFVLNDQEAPGQQPWPYVVMDQPDQTVVERTSSNIENQKREIRDVEVTLNIHARRDPGSGRSAKAFASYLAEEVMKAFGGHPTARTNTGLVLDNGQYLITRYQNDFGIKTGDDEYQWVVIYLIRVDVPVAV